MLRLTLRWFLLAAALLLVDHLYDGIELRSFPAALIAALVLGLLNAILRPILVVLTLPATLLTLGLFLFIINAALFYVAAWMLDGFYVAGFVPALVASVLYSLCAIVIDTALNTLFAERNS